MEREMELGHGSDSQIGEIAQEICKLEIGGESGSL